MLPWLFPLAILGADPLASPALPDAAFQGYLPAQLDRFSACSPLSAATSGAPVEATFDVLVSTERTMLLIPLEALDSPLARCVHEQAAALRFPPYEGDQALGLTITLRFSDLTSPPTLGDLRLQEGQVGLLGAIGTSSDLDGALGGAGGLGGPINEDGLGGLGGPSAGSSRERARDGGPHVSISGDPIILGALDKALIDEVIARKLKPIRRCYERALDDAPGISGKVVIKFVIAKDGSVTKAAVKSTTLNNAAAEGCITELFLGFQFPEPKGGGIVIASYPFLFSP